jgi:hypothetical protein
LPQAIIYPETEGFAVAIQDGRSKPEITRSTV